jgi:hypothetical protein
MDITYDTMGKESTVNLEHLERKPPLMLLSA